MADLGEDYLPGGNDRTQGVEDYATVGDLEFTQSETTEEQKVGSVFVSEERGSIAETDKFDMVSIQSTTHDMMSTKKLAKRVFHTVRRFLEVGGDDLIATLIDARVVVETHMIWMWFIPRWMRQKMKNSTTNCNQSEKKSE